MGSSFWDYWCLGRHGLIDNECLSEWWPRWCPGWYLAETIRAFEKPAVAVSHPWAGDGADVGSGSTATRLLDMRVIGTLKDIRDVVYVVL